MTRKLTKAETTPSCYAGEHLFTVGPPQVGGHLWLCIRCGRLCGKDNVPWYTGPQPVLWEEYARPKPK